jgi:hypothetical protein
LPGPRRRRLWKVGGLCVLVGLAAWLLVVPAVRVDAAKVVPATATFASAHASLAPSVVGSPAVDATMARSYKVPDELAGTYQLVGFRLLDSGPQAVYANGDRAVSVFAVPGRLEVDELPAGSTQATVNGAPAWWVPWGNGNVVFVQRPGEVVVLVGSALQDLLPDVANGMDPDVSASVSLQDHLAAAAQGLLDSFGLKG